MSKEKIAANGDYNLSGERYRVGLARELRYPIVKLGELAENLDSKRVPITQGDRKPGPYPYYGASGIVDRVDGFIFDEDLLLISEDGANLLARSTPIAFSVSGKCWVNNHAHVLRFPNPATQKLIEIYLNSISIEQYVSGAAQPKLNQQALNEIQIPLPPLEVQKEIVTEIEGYQKIINGARTVLDNYRSHIPIHPDWPMVPLGELCEKIQYGLSVPLNTESSGFKTFRMNELVEGRCVDRGDMKCSEIPADEFEKYRLTRGDILFNRTNSFEHVGRTGIFDLVGDYCFASYLIRLIISAGKSDPFFVNAFMNSDGFQQGIKQFASRAIGQSNINAKSLAGYRIMIVAPSDQITPVQVTWMPSAKSNYSVAWQWMTCVVTAGVDAYPRLGDRVYAAPHQFIALLPRLMEKRHQRGKAGTS